MRRALAFLAFVLSFFAEAQQTVPQPLLNLDKVAYNPAISGSNELVSFFVSHRTSSLLRYSVAQGETFLSKHNVAMGALVESYESLLETQNSIRLNLAYRVKTSQGFWQMGVAPVLHQYNLNTNNLSIRNQEDALTPNSVNRWSLNFNAGILYKTNRLLLSAALQNTSKALNPLSYGYGYLIDYQMYSLFASYSFKGGEHWQLVPQVYGQYLPGQGSYVALASQFKHKHFFVGGQYGFPSSWLANAGIILEPDHKLYQLSLGYSIAQQTNGLQNAFIHQVFLYLSLGNGKPTKAKDLPSYRSPFTFDRMYIRLPYLLLLFFLTGISCPALGQGKEGMNFADTLFQKGSYYLASVHYKQALSGSSDTLAQCHGKKKLAQCYALLGDHIKAVDTWQKVLKQCKTDPIDLKQFARSLQSLGEYEKAKRLYAACYQTDTTDQFSYLNRMFCDSVKQHLDRLTEVYLENVSPVNSTFDDVLNEVNNDTLFFLSSRKSKTFDKKIPYHNQYGYHLYRWPSVLKKKAASEIQKVAVGNGFSCTDAESAEVYFTQSIPHPRLTGSTRSVIYQSKRNSSEAPLKFNHDNDSSSYGHPHLSVDGTLFFFVSDMPGGFGGMDVYVCRKIGNKWSAPENLGSHVNTIDNELFPQYVGEGILLFSSNGHAGFGGYDVYATTWRNGNWSVPRNLSLPINSKGDDLGLRCDKTKKIFYLSSNRSKGKGGFDIYKVREFNMASFRNALF